MTGHRRVRKQELILISKDAASAFDALDDVMPSKSSIERGASTFAAAAGVRVNVTLCCRPRLSFAECEAITIFRVLLLGGTKSWQAWQNK